MLNPCLASTTIVAPSYKSPAPSPKFSLPLSPSTTRLTKKIKSNKFTCICRAGKRENAESTNLAYSASVLASPPAKMVAGDQYVLGTLFASSLFAFMFLCGLRFNYKKKKVEESELLECLHYPPRLHFPLFLDLDSHFLHLKKKKKSQNPSIEIPENENQFDFDKINEIKITYMLRNESIDIHLLLLDLEERSLPRKEKGEEALVLGWEIGEKEGKQLSRLNRRRRGEMRSSGSRRKRRKGLLGGRCSGQRGPASWHFELARK